MKKGKKPEFQPKNEILRITAKVKLRKADVSTSLETLLNISQVLNIGLEELLCDFLNFPDSVQTPTSYQILQIVNSLTPQQQSIVLQHLQGLLHWTE